RSDTMPHADPQGRAEPLARPPPGTRRDADAQTRRHSAVTWERWTETSEGPLIDGLGQIASGDLAHHVELAGRRRGPLGLLGLGLPFRLPRLTLLRRPGRLPWALTRWRRGPRPLLRLDPRLRRSRITVSRRWPTHLARPLTRRRR